MQTTLFTSTQIAIPDGLPDVLKQYSKAVIRAAPEDILTFSKAYFDGIVQAGTSQGATAVPLTALIALRQQVSGVTIPVGDLLEKAQANGIAKQHTELIVKLGRFGNEVKLAHFLALAAAYSTPDFAETLAACFEIFDQSGRKGEESSMRTELLLEIAQFLAAKDKTLVPTAENVTGFIAKTAKHNPVTWKTLEKPLREFLSV